MRNLVSVQKIKALLPIEGADRIEVAKINSWNVVVGKGDFVVGDKVAYLEPDSLLPNTITEYDDFQSRGQKTIGDITGHVLKTMKLRGVVSQGLVLSLEKIHAIQTVHGFVTDENPFMSVNYKEALEIGTDITEEARVIKYEAPIPADNGKTIGAFDTKVAPKTDAIRVQGFTPEIWELIKSVEWDATLKVDGTSRTISKTEDGDIRIFGRNWELDPTQDSAMKVVERDGLMTDVLPGWTVQTELVGPGIQSNRLKLADIRLIAFAVWNHGVKVARSDWPASVLKLATPVLPETFAPKNFETIEDAVEFVNGLRGKEFGTDVSHEGAVFHPADLANLPASLLEVLDRNGNFKIINNKFLIKHDL